MKHCGDNKADRDLGAKWEHNFCILAGQYGRSFTPMQLKRETSAQAFNWSKGKWSHWTLPDITVWTYPGEHHEIKHKEPTRGGRIGLEQYRLDALLWFANETKQHVMYTIHNHALSGGRDSDLNRLQDWLTVDVRDLEGTESHRQENGKSYVNSQARDSIPLLYWSIDLWMPLADWWQHAPR